MAKTKFKLDRSSVANLLKSQEIQSELLRRAHAIAGVAGDGWEVDSGLSVRGDRVSATVKAVTFKARKENAQKHTLMRSIDAGRN